MKRVWNYVVTMWQPLGLFVLGILLLAGLFTFKLGTIPPGEATGELQTISSTTSIKTIVKDPINGPYKGALYLMRKANKSLFAARLSGIIFTGLVVMVFYLLARHFTSRISALAGSALFATSSALLHAARIIMPHVSLLILFVLVAAGFLFHFHSNRKSAWLIMSLAVAFALYTPGMLLFIVLAAAWQLKTMRSRHEKPELLILVACLFIILIALTPLMYGFIRSPSLWHEYFAVPQVLPHFQKLIINILAVPYGVFITAPRNVLYRVGRQPLLDIFAGVMFILGCYSLVKRYKLDRLILLIGVFILAIIITAVSGDYENSFMLLPFVYLLVAFGIGYLLEQWLKVFPNNPLAKWLAVSVIAVAVIVSCNFQSRRYFVAWPHNATVQATFKHI
jgi:hypothetical protein